MIKQFETTPQLLIFPLAATNTSINQLDLVMEQLPQHLNSTPNNPDFTVINQDGLGIKIEQVRTIIADASYPPYQGSVRVVVLLHLDQASAPAQQALLKFLEEPPEYVRIIATTSQLTSILPTILSRCFVKFVSPSQPAPAQTNHHALIEQLLTNQLSYAQIIKLVEPYAERPAAIIFIQELLGQLQTSPHYPNPHTVKLGQLLTNHWVQLHHNTNVRLTLETCFFSFKNQLV